MRSKKRRGVIYTVAPSYRDLGTIWAGTDDGLVHITKDGGKNWTNVTPPELKSWMKVSLIDAGRFDADTAYAAINTFRLDDLRPHIFRTHDGGKTWKEITNGLPNGGIVNAVREDPVRKGLLYCGTEQAVYFSTDDGDHWQPLRLNMPATSIRDLVVKTDDVVVGTHGRSFWILDDITPLRQINKEVAGSEAHLFAPQTAIRYKRSLHTDTPFPPEEPAGQNPPDGAIINYYLRSKSAAPITLEIFDSANQLVRRFASDDKPLEVDLNRINPPEYWVRPFQSLKNEAGMQRFVWNLQYPNPPADRFDLPISAIYKDTPFVPEGPLVMPGTLTVKLTVNGKSYTQNLSVKIDPRVKTPTPGLQQQFALSLEAYEGIKQTSAMLDEVRKLQAKLKSANEKELEAKLNSLLNGKGGNAPAPVSELPLNRLNGAFVGLLDTLQDADVMPSSQAISASKDLQIALKNAVKMWGEIKAEAEKKGYK